MRRCVVVLTAAALVLTIAAPAFAQQRQQARQQARRPVPDKGMAAVGVSVGAALPNEPSFANGFDLAAQVEGYLTPRVSVRGQFSGAWWDIRDHPYTGSVDPIVLDGNLVYNFEHGVWHPYVTGGVGAYRYHWTEPGVPNGSNTYSGVNLGGGVEYFFTRDATLTTEFIFHKVGDVDVARATLHDGSFWSVTMGGKKYF